jgi:magnesium transporter
MDTDQIILEQYAKNHPQKAITALKELEDEQVVAFLESVSLDVTIRLISSMSGYRAARYLEKVNMKLVLAVFEKIDLGLKRAILRQCSETFRSRLLEQMNPKQSALLRRKLSFAPETVGYLMDPVLKMFKKEFTAAESIVIAKNEKERISSGIVVVDDNGRPEGLVRLRDLFLAENDIRLSALMNQDFPRFRADKSIESIRNHPGWHQHQSIPVIDGSEMLIGTLDFGTIGGNEFQKADQYKNAMETSSALGELYRIGLTSLIQSVSK